MFQLKTLFYVLCSGLVILLIGMQFAYSAENGGGSDLSDGLTEAFSEISSNCWSCKVYVSVYQSLMNAVSEVNRYFVETKEILGFAIVVTGCVTILMIIKIVAMPIWSSVNYMGESKKIYLYFVRISVVFVLLTTGLVSSMWGNSGTEDHPLKMLLVDAPLLIGTEIGVRSVEAGQKIFGVNLDVRSCPDSSADIGPIGGAGGNLSSYSSQHVNAACGLLYGFHKLGVAGMSSGLWLAFRAPTGSDNAGIAAMIAVILAGIIMAACFLWFTIVFGLRFLDALLRGLIVLSFLPVFAFFWLFDSTRSIAHAGIKSVLFMGAVFAASGIVFVVCLAIMSYGLSAAAGGGGGGGDAGQAFLSGFASGEFNNLVGIGSEKGATWVSFFYILATWAMATGLARSVFVIASDLVEFSGGLMGMGEQAEGDVKNFGSSLISKVTPIK